MVNNNGELYCDTKGTQTCSVDIINTINKYLSLKCLSYEDAYKFFKYLLEIENETNWYIQPISTLSKTGINIDNKMTQKQFNELMNKNHNNKYRSIQIFNDEKYNGYIVFLPTQFMPNK